MTVYHVTEWSLWERGNLGEGQLWILESISAFLSSLMFTQKQDSKVGFLLGLGLFDSANPQKDLRTSEGESK